MWHYRPWRGNLPIGSVLLLLLALLVMLALLPAQAQSDQRCFSETGHCIHGRIRDYWEQNGGLPVFGYPISAQRPFTIEGQPMHGDIVHLVKCVSNIRRLVVIKPKHVHCRRIFRHGTTSLG